MIEFNALAVRAYIDSPDFMKAFNKAPCTAGIKVILDKIDNRPCLGRTLGGMVRINVEEMLLKRFPFMTPFSKEECLSYTISKGTILIKTHYSHQAAGSPNLGSPSVAIKRLENGILDEIHIFLNGLTLSTRGQLQLSPAGRTVNSLYNLMNAGFVKYPDSMTSNQLQLVKGQSLALISAVPFHMIDTVAQKKKLLHRILN